MTLQIGKTKVFLRAGQMAELDARRAEILTTAAKSIQRRIRTHVARKNFIALKKASIYVQSYCRGEPWKNRILNMMMRDGFFEFQFIIPW